MVHNEFESFLHVFIVFKTNQSECTSGAAKDRCQSLLWQHLSEEEDAAMLQIDVKVDSSAVRLSAAHLWVPAAEAKVNRVRRAGRERRRRCWRCQSVQKATINTAPKVPAPLSALNSSCTPCLHACLHVSKSRGFHLNLCSVICENSCSVTAICDRHQKKGNRTQISLWQIIDPLHSVYAEPFLLGWSSVKKEAREWKELHKKEEGEQKKTLDRLHTRSGKLN